MGFEFIATVKRFLAGPTKFALAIYPFVLHALEPDVACIIGETSGNGVLSAGVFRAVHASPRQHAGEMGDADAEDLPRKDMVHALLKVGNLDSQPFGEAAGDFAQEHAGF